MPGAPEPQYTLARRALLDALDALGDQRAAVIVVGAQAIYLHTGEGDIAVAPFTTDGDLALVPALLRDQPRIAEALETAGFVPTHEIGIWAKHGWLDRDKVLVTIDARWAGSTRGAARRPWRQDRPEGERPRSDKDALDLLRLLRVVPTADLVARFTRLLADPASDAATRRALALLADLFGHPVAVGSRMAARAVETLEDPETIAASCAALTRDLLRVLEAGGSAGASFPRPPIRR